MKLQKIQKGAAILPVILVMLIAGCGERGGKTVTGTATDIDGNIYGTVKIGGQVWMAENLRVIRYRNGDAIADVQDPATWSERESGARCSYENSPENGKKMGQLYNWYAVNDPRDLAPEGWHVATDKEWRELVETLGGNESAGNVMKASGEWNDSGEKSGKNSGFNALPSGARRDSDGGFVLLGEFARFWTPHRRAAARLTVGLWSITMEPSAVAKSAPETASPCAASRIDPF